MTRAQLNEQAAKAGVKRPEKLPNKDAVIAAIDAVAGGPPCATLREATEHLRRPFSVNAVRFKIQTNPKSDQGSALVVTYIDARLVAARLDVVVPGLWTNDYEETAGGLRGLITIDGVTRKDVGWSGGTSDNIGVKTLHSDAFKRAGVLFGVGAYLYSLPKQYIRASNLKKTAGRGGDNWWLTDSAERQLRDGYEKWLKSSHPFGPVLDHGDVADAQGDVETSELPPAEGELEGIDSGAELEARAALLELTKQVVDAGIWDKKKLKLNLVSASATDTSSFSAAIQTMPFEKVNELGAKIIALLEERTAATNGSRA